MATRKTDHTGFRNGELFCFNCGTSQAMPLPMDIRLAADFMESFAKIHKACSKTWTEPVAEPNTDNSNIGMQKNVNWWIANGEHGISSKTMLNHIMRVQVIKNDRHMPPADPDDFRRCYLLVKAVPQLKGELYRLKELSAVWSKLVDNWDKLTEMLEEEMKTRKDKECMTL